MQIVLLLFNIFSVVLVSDQGVICNNIQKLSAAFDHGKEEVKWFTLNDCAIVLAL
jgi:hypothetical protein